VPFRRIVIIIVNSSLCCPCFSCISLVSTKNDDRRYVYRCHTVVIVVVIFVYCLICEWTINLAANSLSIIQSIYQSINRIVRAIYRHSDRNACIRMNSRYREHNCFFNAPASVGFLTAIVHEHRTAFANLFDVFTISGLVDFKVCMRCEAIIIMWFR